MRWRNKLRPYRVYQSACRGAIHRALGSRMMDTPGSINRAPTGFTNWFVGGAIHRGGGAVERMRGRNKLRPVQSLPIGL
jgi:hypothetical protein